MNNNAGADMDLVAGSEIGAGICDWVPSAWSGVEPLRTLQAGTLPPVAIGAHVPQRDAPGGANTQARLAHTGGDRAQPILIKCARGDLDVTFAKTDLPRAGPMTIKVGERCASSLVVIRCNRVEGNVANGIDIQSIGAHPGHGYYIGAVMAERPAVDDNAAANKGFIASRRIYTSIGDRIPDAWSRIGQLRGLQVCTRVAISIRRHIREDDVSTRVHI